MDLVTVQFADLSAIWAQGFVAGGLAILAAIPIRLIIKAAKSL